MLCVVTRAFPWRIDRRSEPSTNGSSAARILRTARKMLFFAASVLSPMADATSLNRQPLDVPERESQRARWRSAAPALATRVADFGAQHQAIRSRQRRAGARRPLSARGPRGRGRPRGAGGVRMRSMEQFTAILWSQVRKSARASKRLNC